MALTLMQILKFFYLVVEWTAWVPSCARPTAIHVPLHSKAPPTKSLCKQFKIKKQEECKKIPTKASHSSVCLVWALLPGRQSTSTNILIVWLNFSSKKREGSSCQNPIASCPLYWAGHLGMLKATSAVKTHLVQNHVVNTLSNAVVQFCSLDWQEDSSLVQLSGYSLLIARNSNETLNRFCSHFPINKCSRHSWNSLASLWVT